MQFSIDRTRKLISTLSFAALSLSACSPLYVIEAAYHESGILLRRQDIDSALKSGTLSQQEQAKLGLVKEAREFTIKLGLNPGQTYTKYSKVDRDVLAWVLMASQPDSFRLHTWWFPIVGSVPYKGYFSKEDATCAGKSLEFEGYEIFVRGTDAFSTLGWFNDPVLSTTLRHPDVRVVNTIIHETLHRSVWIPGYVDFNESLANFVGAQGAVDFYKARCQNNSNCLQEVNTALESKSQEFELADVVVQLYQKLEALYNSDISREDKLIKRTEVFEESMAPVWKKYPNMKILKTLNNAEIVQLKIYLTELGLFQKLWDKRSGSWEAFLADMRDIKDSVSKDRTMAPFDLLRQKIEMTS